MIQRLLCGAAVSSAGFLTYQVGLRAVAALTLAAQGWAHAINAQMGAL